MDHIGLPPLARVMGVGRQHQRNGGCRRTDVERAFVIRETLLMGDSGADLAATSRIRNGWMKFRELLPFLTSRAPPLEMKDRVYASCVEAA